MFDSGILGVRLSLKRLLYFFLIIFKGKGSFEWSILFVKMLLFVVILFF